MKRSILPTIQHVAEKAGVSSATVSRFFTRRSLVSDATASRIQQAVEELEYRPNLMAGGLASRRTRLVAILVPALAQSPFNAMIEAVAEALGQWGYTAMLGVTGNKDEHLREVLDTAYGRRVDCIILTGVIADEATRVQLRDTDISVIETWGLPADPIDCAVGFSHRNVGKATAEYINHRGYSRPLIITAQGARAFERREGFVESWRSLGGGNFEEIEVESPSNFSQARGVFRKLRAFERQPDVIICGSDGMAQGLIVEASHAGISIPDELAIMGFGNQAIAAGMRPSITTIATDGARIGLEAARLLHQRSEDKASSESTVDVGFQIIARESA